jgi:hypothetical protein
MQACPGAAVTGPLRDARPLGDPLREIRPLRALTDFGTHALEVSQPLKTASLAEASPPARAVATL